MIEGKIVKLLKDLYFVDSNEGVFSCKARGQFRNRKFKPLVGDLVIFEKTNANEGYIIKVQQRINVVKRPNIANVDQLFVFVTLKDPEFNSYNLDKYLAMCHHEHIPVYIVLSKTDMLKEEEINNFVHEYKAVGYDILLLDNTKFDNRLFTKVIKGKTTAVSGASGVGKSSLINNLLELPMMEVGEISKKLKRGKNTTRHIELIKLSNKTYIFDTPGFDSFDLDNIEDERELKKHFIEFINYDTCKFSDCNHINEPNCKIKNAVLNGKISESRYNNYLLLYDQLKKRRKEKW